MNKNVASNVRVQEMFGSRELYSSESDLDVAQYEREVQTFGWASFEVYSGIANILLAAYFINRFKKLLKHMNQAHHQTFVQSVSLSIAAIFASIIVSSTEILGKMDILLRDPGWTPNTFSCDPDGCMLCVICHKINRVAAIARNCCVYLIFLRSVEIHFNTGVSLPDDANNASTTKNKKIKICLISLQIANMIVRVVFGNARLFQLADSDHIVCFRWRTTISTVTGIINGSFLLIFLIAIIVVFFKQSRQVESIQLNLISQSFLTWYRYTCKPLLAKKSLYIVYNIIYMCMSVLNTYNFIIWYTN